MCKGKVTILYVNEWMKKCQANSCTAVKTNTYKKNLTKTIKDTPKNVIYCEKKNSTRTILTTTNCINKIEQIFFYEIKNWQMLLKQFTLVLKELNKKKTFNS